MKFGFYLNGGPLNRDSDCVTSTDRRFGAFENVALESHDALHPPPPPLATVVALKYLLLLRLSETRLRKDPS